jgi:glycosyltransferase involved in cell wall biosynthesis
MNSSDSNNHDRLLSILMPVYNERAYLRPIVEKVLSAPLPDGMRRELVMVDDCSSDGTGDLVDEIAAAHPDIIRAFHQQPNQGKGAAIRRAIEEMRGQYAIIQDADLEYDPNEYPVVLQPLMEGRADVVYGSRFAPSRMRRVLNYRHSLGNKFLTMLSNWCTQLNLTDMETCYKAFRSDVLKTIPLRSNRFGMEPEITAKIAKRRCVVYEVPISYYGRSYAEGKKIGWKDGVSAVYTILKYWLIDDCFDERYGEEILSDLSSARRFNVWMVDSLNDDLGDDILEVGSGIGNISHLLPKKERLTVTDCDDRYLELLHESFDDNDLVDIEKYDITSAEDTERLKSRGFDTVVCLNVLEHIEDDTTALKNMGDLLEDGGRLVLLVPQYEKLYGTYDKKLDHYRRYNKKALVRKLRSAGLKPVRSRNFNALAIAG